MAPVEDIHSSEEEEEEEDDEVVESVRRTSGFRMVTEQNTFSQPSSMHSASVQQGTEIAQTEKLDEERQQAELREAQLKAQQEAMQRAQEAQRQAQQEALLRAQQAEAQAKAQQEALRRAQLAKEQAETQAEAQAKAQQEALRRAQLAKEQAEAQAKAQAEAQARAQAAAAQAKAQAEAQAKAQAEAQARAQAAQAKAQAEAQARAAAQAKAQAEAQARAAAQAKAQKEAELKAQAEREARIRAQAKAQQEAARKAQETKKTVETPLTTTTRTAQQPQQKPVISPQVPQREAKPVVQPPQKPLSQVKAPPAVPVKQASIKSQDKDERITTGVSISSQQRTTKTLPNEKLIPDTNEGIRVIRGGEVQQAYLHHLERPSEVHEQQEVRQIQAMDDASWVTQTRVTTDILLPQPAKIIIPELHGSVEVKPTVIVPRPALSTRVDWKEFPDEEHKEMESAPKVKAQEWHPDQQGEIVGSQPVRSAYRPNRIGKVWPPTQDENEAPASDFHRTIAIKDTAWIHDEKTEAEKGIVWGRSVPHNIAKERVWPPPGDETDIRAVAGSRLPNVQWPPPEFEQQIQQEVEVIQTRLPVKPHQRQWPPPPPQYQMVEQTSGDFYTKEVPLESVKKTTTTSTKRLIRT